MSWSPWVYIVLLGFAAILYGWMQPKIRQQQTTIDGQTGNVEETLEQFMAEMERDNEEIIGLIADMKQETLSKQMSQQELITELRQRLQAYERQNLMLETRLEQLEKSALVTNTNAGRDVNVNEMLTPAVQADAAPHVEQQPLESSTETEQPLPTVRERYPELFELYDEGKSIDTVAKATGMARGEVQLILQLAKREGSSL
ncbi:hypothetical protein GCM10010917_25960 [Paenibacillus physcomitrellae]|uniref:DUF2802 domain-containing protein n=1 Tax=Paenibacillus physcomitrellae TaxID=1619311 RepID=A0ABQ1G9X8_9BACL|nr:hypothetical protein GCM10010917_25960 [Paenibacillus physcomitrellae]